VLRDDSSAIADVGVRSLTFLFSLVVPHPVMQIAKMAAAKTDKLNFVVFIEQTFLSLLNTSFWASVLFFFFSN
jgi:hypothetical protein